MASLQQIKEKANALFHVAGYLAHIHNDAEYEEALETMDELIDDYEVNRDLIEILSRSIHRWEENSPEFSEFNKKIEKIDSGEAVLRTLMQHHHLGVADFPEIGTKSLISKILNNQRKLTREHILLLSKRFNISPALFF